MKFMASFIAAILVGLFLSACSTVPKFSKKDEALMEGDPLPYVKTSPYSESLENLAPMIKNSPYATYDNIVIQVKPVANKTGCKQLPIDLTDMIKTAANRIGGTVRITPYDPNYLIMEAKTGANINRVRPVLVIDGSIVECDEKISEVSSGIDGSAKFGKGKGKGDIKAKEATQKSYSRIAIDLHLVNHADHTLIPGKQTSMAVDVWEIKKYRRIGFQVNGSGLGIDGRRKATQEKHNAVRTLVDLSILQLLGKFFEIPYWKLVDGAKPDDAVLGLMRKGYEKRSPKDQLIITQNLLARHGYDVGINGEFDTQTRQALKQYTTGKPHLKADTHPETYLDLALNAPLTDKPRPAGAAVLSESATGSDTLEMPPISVHTAFIYIPNGTNQPRLMQNGATLNSGDEYRLVILPDGDCFLYLFQVDSAGRLYMLFPLDEAGAGDINPIRHGTPYELPGRDEAFVLDRQRGKEKIFLIASPEKDELIEKMKDHFSSHSNPDARLQAEKIIGSHLATLQKVTETLPGKNIALTDYSSGAKINIPTRKIEALKGSRLFELEFNHQ